MQPDTSSYQGVIQAMEDLWSSTKEYFPRGLTNSAKYKLEEDFMYVMTSLPADGSPSPVGWRGGSYREVSLVSPSTVT